jgi:hypothetical protein
MKRLLLISNSTLYGGGYLDHAVSEIRDFLEQAVAAKCGVTLDFAA